MPPSALYLHLPFCLRRCAYCAFTSSVYSPAAADRYLEALFAEGERRLEGVEPRTVYVGGGTPTCLSTGQLGRLLDWLRRLPLDRLEEFTIEANPGTVTADKARLLHEAGVTRVSLGAQTFDPEGLRRLGRLHTARETQTAVALLGEHGIDRISLDLIFAWPGETLSVWRRDLEAALRLRPRHLSCYGLTWEEGTPLTRQRERGECRGVDEETDRGMFDAAGQRLGSAGLPRYEISNFAAPGDECKHNRVYWTGGEYVGLGAGAHSFVGGLRCGNEEDPAVWAAAVLAGDSAVRTSESLPPERRARECAVVWLRLTEGIDACAFRERTGFDLVALFARELPALLDGGWLSWSEGRERLRLTPEALPIADSVLSELV